MSKKEQLLYFSIKDKILEMIDTENYNAGDQLPTEFELCGLFEVSRTTVRQALNQLKLEGYVYQVQGSGTFVSSSKIEQPLSSGISFIDTMKHLGLTNETNVIEFTIVPATMSIAKRLLIPEGDPVFRLIRTRYVEAAPLLYSKTYIPWKVTPGLTQEDCKGSLYSTLQRNFNQKLTKCVEQIEPILIDEQASTFLDVPVGAPALLLNSVTFNDKEEPVEYTQEIYRGDRSMFTFERNLLNEAASLPPKFVR